MIIEHVSIVILSSLHTGALFQKVNDEYLVKWMKFSHESTFSQWSFYCSITSWYCPSGIKAWMFYCGWSSLTSASQPLTFIFGCILPSCTNHDDCCNNGTKTSHLAKRSLFHSRQLAAFGTECRENFSGFCTAQCRQVHCSSSNIVVK